ncbi:MAG TPA: hypothetical protein VED37_17225 [Ktedonobacteraceae bacterium]|nr:hypothetical protein [Ktedonobacteraceae bacterium]
MGEDINQAGQGSHNPWIYIVSKAYPDQYASNSLQRRALLEEASRTFDAIPGHLGSKSFDISPRKTLEGKLASEMIDQDKLEFNDFPLLEKITDQDFEACKMVIPARFEQLSQNYNFYKVLFRIYLHSASDWSFDHFRLALGMHSPTAPQQLQPISYEILPAKKFQQYLKAGSGVTIYFDTNFELMARTSTNASVSDVSMTTHASSDSKSIVGLEVGSLPYGLKKIKLDHSELGTQKVWWKLIGSEFFEKESLEFLLVMQVPKETVDVNIEASMSAARYFQFANTSLRYAVSQLSEAPRLFFEEGCPIEAVKTWNLTQQLKK